MQIYLLNESKFQGVQNLVLNQIVYYDFKADLREFDALLISSQNAIKALVQSSNALNLNLQVYAVGAKTAEAALKLGFKKVKFPKNAYAKELVKEFGFELKTKKCLYLRAKTISSNLDQDLLALGVDLKQIIVYENIYKPSKNFKLIQPCILIFTSPLSVRNFLKNFSIHSKDKLIALGSSTAAQLKDYENNLFISPEQSLQSCIALAKELNKNLHF